MQEADHALILAFTDDSQSFRDGWEAALIYNSMESGKQIDQTVRMENKEMIIAIANLFKYDFCFEDSIAEGWLDLTATKKVVTLTVVK